MRDYRLIEFFEDRHVEPFDPCTDIGEEHNPTPSDPDRVRGMQARLAARRSEIDAAMPTDNPDYEAWPNRAPSGSFAPGE